MKIIKDNIYVKRFGYFNIYVIKGKNGDVLVDTGFLFMRKWLAKWLDTFNIKMIILTHAHIDHVWNASFLQKRYNCLIAMGKEDVNSIDNSHINSVPVNNKCKYRTKLMNFFMRHLVPEPFKVDIKLEDDYIIDKYGLNIRCVGLPGHTYGSIGVLYKNVLIAGDALVNRRWGKAEIAYQNQNNELAIKSANKILELKPDCIYIGHERRVTYDKLVKSMKYINNYNKTPHK